jgi:hypothetical protein
MCEWRAGSARFPESRDIAYGNDLLPSVTPLQEAGSNMLTLFTIMVLSVPQQVVTVGPPVADTTWVSGLLEAAEEELQGLREPTVYPTVGRLARAWVQWGEPQRGADWIVAVSSADPSVPFVLQKPLYQPWLNLAVTQYMDGDRLAARRREALLPPEARDALRNQLAIDLFRSGRIQEADSVVELIADPVQRAMAVLDGTRGGDPGLALDDVVARLQAELTRIEDVANGSASNVRLYIRARLLELGVEASPSDVPVRVEPGQAQRSPFPWPEPNPLGSNPSQLEIFDAALRRAEEEGDFVALGERLTAMDEAGYGEESLWRAVHIGFRLWNARFQTVPPDPGVIDGVLRVAWSLGADLDGSARDSARVHLVVPTWSALDVDSALTRALEIETARFRERAVADFVARLDLDEAARLTAGFEDEQASNRGFSQLARQHLRSGQVDPAQAAAERTVSGEARVWALTLVAEARWTEGDSLSARGLIRAAVNEMADEPECEHCFVVVGPGVVPAPPTTPPSLLTPVIATAYGMGETAVLERWAASRSDSDARARSYILIAEVVEAVHSADPWSRPRWGVWGR